MEKTVEQTGLSWALEWILANREVINVSGLEQRAGLPWKSLQSFAIAGRRGYFPKKHIPQLEKTILELNTCTDNVHEVYADKLVDIWKSRVKERKVFDSQGMKESANNMNIRAEQVIDDLIYLHQSIKEVNGDAANRLAARIIARAGKSLALRHLLK